MRDPPCPIGPRLCSAHAAGAGEDLPPHLTGSLVDDGMAVEGEANARAVAARARAVQVEGRRRVRYVLALNGYEVSRDMLSIGSGVNHPGPLQRADDEGGGDITLDVDG